MTSLPKCDFVGDDAFLLYPLEEAPSPEFNLSNVIQEGARFKLRVLKPTNASQMLAI